jgi:hypothetical protein
MDIHKLIEKLEEMVPDVIPREELRKFELGKLAGKIEILDYIKKLIQEK